MTRLLCTCGEVCGEDPNCARHGRDTDWGKVEALEAALAEYGAYIKPCPINNPRGRAYALHDKCEKCGARADQNCGLAATASLHLVKTLRCIVSPAPTSEVLDGAYGATFTIKVGFDDNLTSVHTQSGGLTDPQQCLDRAIAALADEHARVANCPRQKALTKGPTT